VTQRLYQGYCAHNGALPGVRTSFLGSSAEIRALIEAEPRLTPDAKGAALAFIGEFFATLQDDARFRAEIVGNCRD